MNNKPDFTNLRQFALEALLEQDFEKKVALTQYLHAHAATLVIANETDCSGIETAPGCPAKPELRGHLDMPKRSPFTHEGLAALLHSVTHIEFNAINLALDAAWRFGAMPNAYYLDWVRVAAEEAHHFTMLHAHLKNMGFTYGDFPAHTGLWDMTHKTRGDVLGRMALVPRTLEARGLDATPPMQAKLRRVGTPDALQAVNILDIILRDEIGHVAIGNHWYRFLCLQRGLEPIATYAMLAKLYEAPRLKGPLNLQARRDAGFDESELAILSLVA